jgi:hypothetical protein
MSRHLRGEIGFEPWHKGERAPLEKDLYSYAVKDWTVDPRSGIDRQYLRVPIHP